MTPFALVAPTDPAAAIRRVTSESRATYIAGGTDLLQLLQERVAHPAELVDISRLPFDDVATTLDGMRIGALATLADVADHPGVRENYPAIAQALAASASPMVRNQATVAGNLLQRTRCLYFRDVTTPCNKRRPGSGCPALGGANRGNAVLGTSAHCIATHASDLAVALVACDAEVMVAREEGQRTYTVEELHRTPGDTPHVETILRPGDLITHLYLPIAAAGRRSLYLKVRDRASFEWAVCSAAVSLGFDGDRVLEARLALGGVATKPWRLPAVESLLTGRRLDARLAREAGALATEGAVARGRNAYKIPLIARTLERALLQVGGLA